MPCKKYLSDNSVNIQKIFLTAAFIAAALAAIVAWLNPSTGFEVSIYRATPVLFWIFFVFSLVTSIVLVLVSIYGKTSPKYIRYLAFFLLFLNAIILSTLYLIRGYNILDLMGDTGYHVGYTYNLLDELHLSSAYPYQGLYLETVSLYYLTGINIDTLMNTVSLFYHIVLLLGVYLLAREVCMKKGEAAFCFILAALYIFGSSMYITMCCNGRYTPTCVAVYLFPLLLYLAFKLRNNFESNLKLPFCLLVILFITSICIHHVLIGLFAVIFMICLFIQECICNFRILSKRSNHTNTCKRSNSSVTLLILTIISSAIWFGYTNLIGRLSSPISAIQNLITTSQNANTLLTKTPPSETSLPEILPAETPSQEILSSETIQSGASLVETVPTETIHSEIMDGIAASTLNERGNSWYDALMTFLSQSPSDMFEFAYKYLGIFLILTAVMLILIPFIYRSIKLRGEYKNFISLYIFGVCLIFLAILPLVATGSYEPGRPLFILTLIGLLCVGVFINLLITKINVTKQTLKKIGIILVILLLLGNLGYLGVISTYYSMELHQRPIQTTNGHLAGDEFYFEKCNLNEVIMSYGTIEPFRYVHVLYHTDTMENPLSKKRYSWGYLDPIEEHFGYTDNLNRIGDIYDTTGYISILKNGVEVGRFNEEIYHRESQINDTDLLHLSYDTTVHKLYDDSDVKLYRYYSYS